MDSGRRRRLLQAISAAMGVGVAGCNGLGEDIGPEPDGRNGSPPANGGGTDTDDPPSTQVTVTSTSPGGTESPTAGGSPTTSQTPSRTGTESPSPTGSPTPSPTESPSPTPTPGADAVRVTALEPATDTVTQGGTVDVAVTLRNTAGREIVRPLSVRGDDGLLRRTRIALAPDGTRSSDVTLRLDRPGTTTVRAGDAATSVDVETYPTSFLGVDGTDFVVDGEPWPLFGANNAYLTHKSHKTVDEVLADAASLGLNAVRLLIAGAGTGGYCREFACGRSHIGLQPRPREYDEAAFERLDYAIAAAKRHGLRLIVPLLTLAPGGIEAYLEWVDGAETLDDFFSNGECRAIYRDFLETVLTRENTYTGVEYRNDPTIAIWELANEPELEEGAPYGSALQDWIGEMAGHAKAVDANHLVSAGLIGWSDDGTEPDYLACFDHDAVDAASTHLYYDAKRVDTWIERHATGVHDRLEKPLYVGEFGWDATRTEADYEQQRRNRHEGFKEWIDQLVAHDVAGGLVWFLIGHLDDGGRFPDHDGFGVYVPEDGTTAGILADHASRVGADEVDPR